MVERKSAKKTRELSSQEKDREMYRLAELAYRPAYPVVQEVVDEFNGIQSDWTASLHTRPNTLPIIFATLTRDPEPSIAQLDALAPMLGEVQQIFSQVVPTKVLFKRGRTRVKDYKYVPENLNAFRPR